MGNVEKNVRQFTFLVLESKRCALILLKHKIKPERSKHVLIDLVKYARFTNQK